MKMLFTLIELIITIVVIGILTAIVIPNISSFKEEAKETATISEGRNLQTAVDMYQLDNDGNFPAVKKEGDSTKLELGNPKSLNFDMLYPEYIRDLPKHKGMYYWVDFQGQVYYSTIDNPIDFNREDSKLTWTANEKASGYTILELESNNTGSSNKQRLNPIIVLEGDSSSFVPTGYSKEKAYFISVIDEYGYEAPPVKSGYRGSIPFEKEENQEEIVTPPKQEVPLNDMDNQMIATGAHHSLIVDENGDLWSFGLNDYGQLGHTRNFTNPNPVAKHIMSEVKSVSAGYSHTLVVKKNGELWTFGSNAHGQLGHPENKGLTTRNAEAKMVLTGVKSAVAGDYHSLVITENGDLLGFGNNSLGQLGHAENIGTSVGSSDIKFIMSGVKSVAAGNSHTLILKENKELWGLGRNMQGQLGVADNFDKSIANYTPLYIMSEVKSVEAGMNFSAIINEKNELLTFGHNLYGQLGHSENIGTKPSSFSPKKVMSNVQSVEAGGYHVLALTSEGFLWSFGENNFGQLGRLDNLGTTNPTPDAIQIMSGVKAFSAGNLHSLVQLENGKLLSFGRNSYGSLGHSTNSGTSTPTPNSEQIILTK